jgi:predicted TIM-barrel fold metal-dependent hydrolase
MNVFSAVRGAGLALAGAGLVAVTVAAGVSSACQTRPATGTVPAGAQPVPALTPYIEVHTHFDEHDIDGAIQSALAAVSRQNAAKVFFQIPPDTYDHPGHYDADVILSAASKHPDRLAVLGGGGSLNAMIQQSVASGNAGDEVQRQFEAAAEALIRDGVVGFGEMTAEHFDGATPYQSAPADHPLFLLLADIAARHGVPIDLHMEAVPAPMPLPPGLKSPPNPSQLHDNITAFERLLAHNPRATIIWAHAGSDNTGYRTPDLSRQMLQAHANLYIEIKVDPLSHGKNYPMLDDGTIKPDWLTLFQEFPDRFIVGSDQHYPEPPGTEQRWQTVVLLLNQLPSDLRRTIGTDNALRIFGRGAAPADDATEK